MELEQTLKTPGAEWEQKPEPDSEALENGQELKWALDTGNRARKEAKSKVGSEASSAEQEQESEPEPGLGSLVKPWH